MPPTLRDSCKCMRGYGGGGLQDYTPDGWVGNMGVCVRWIEIAPLPLAYTCIFIYIYIYIFIYPSAQSQRGHIWKDVGALV